jgi:putative flavoprotein involved in K+ transport
MENTTVVVIGAGQAGLAMSWHLTERGIDHVILERSDVANSWRTERWDSLRLLTPNWQTRLPGWTYQGDDPDGYQSAADIVGSLTAYATAMGAPIQTDTTVRMVEPGDGQHLVRTDRGDIRCRAVVIATGACSTPRIPALGAELPGRIRQIAPIHYRNPGEVEGRVLVVGASASGAQIADELARAGAEVTLAVGEHVRLPRTYRGMDIHWWMDQIGLLDERYDEVDDIARVRRTPSLQLIGSPERRTLDLNALQETGVRVVGRFAGLSAGKAQLSGSLASVCAAADLKQGRLLRAIDDHARTHGLDGEIHAPYRPAATAVPTPLTTMSIDDIDTVVWATGFRPDYPWLPDELLDPKGAIVHDGGVMTAPGHYVLGLPFLRRRKSSFLDGVGPDARDLAAHLALHLDGLAGARSTGAAA